MAGYVKKKARIALTGMLVIGALALVTLAMVPQQGAKLGFKLEMPACYADYYYGSYASAPYENPDEGNGNPCCSQDGTITASKFSECWGYSNCYIKIQSARVVKEKGKIKSYPCPPLGYPWGCHSIVGEKFCGHYHVGLRLYLVIHDCTGKQASVNIPLHFGGYGAWTLLGQKLSLAPFEELEEVDDPLMQRAIMSAFGQDLAEGRRKKWMMQRVDDGIYVNKQEAYSPDDAGLDLTYTYQPGPALCEIKKYGGGEFGDYEALNLIGWANNSDHGISNFFENNCGTAYKEMVALIGGDDSDPKCEVHIDRWNRCKAAAGCVVEPWYFNNNYKGDFNYDPDEGCASCK